MAEELIYKVGVDGTNELDKLQKKVTETGKATNKTTDYLTQMRRELRIAQGEMMKYTEGTEQYNRALAKASDIQGKMNSIQSKTNAGIQSLGKTTRNVTGAMAGFAGGFQVVQSAMTLFGIENEEATKTILKLQQTMAMVQGLGAFAKGISDMRNLVAGFKASAAGASAANENMGELTKTSDSMGDSMKNTGKESAVLGSNLAGTNKVSSDMKDNFEKLGETIKTDSQRMDEMNLRLLKSDKANIMVGESTVHLSDNMRTLLKREGALNGTIEEKLAILDKEKKRLETRLGIIDESTEKTSKLGKATEKLDKGIEKGAKGFSKFTKSILSSLGTMAIFLGVIALVTLAISAIIEEISKIPEKTKIEIDLKASVSEQLGKDRLEIQKFSNDLRRATLKDEKTRIDSIRKIGKEQRGLTDAQLDQIAETEDGWKIAFENYLKIAEQTYRAEAIMKKKIDAEIAIETEMFAAKQKFMSRSSTGGMDGKVRSGLEKLTWEELVELSKVGGISKFMWDTFDLWGIPQEIVDHLRIVNDSNAIIKNLPEINFDDLDFGTGKDSGKKSERSKVSPGAAPDGSVKTPNKVENDMEVQYLKRRNVLIRELSEEEIAIYEENMRRKDVTVSDSLIKYTEYQIKLGKARAKDLENQKAFLQDSLSKTEDYYEEELAVQNKQLEDAVFAHNMQLDNMREFLAQKDELETENSELRSRRAELDGELDAKEIAAIDARLLKIKELRQANIQNISDTQELLVLKKEQVKEIENSLALLNNTPEEIARLKEELDILNLAIADNSRFLVDSMADNMQAMLDQAKVYTDTMSQTFGSLESMTNDFMQAKDNDLAKEKNNLELSQAYREADSEQQQQMMYELELANYEAKKKTFETNKAFQIGAVVTQSASNQIDIIKAWLDPKTGGPLSPANIAVAAAATAANVATTIGSIKQISSTSLEKPVPPGGAGTGQGGVGNIALNPNKTGLTSKEENLNMMYKSGKANEKVSVVKVSDINNVQNKVSVREKNSSY